ncbi:outer membrane beta-barrel protein [Candidatus Puniceispirillum sp.]|nr:outer membrane beta-barrel protein [Candidatus Puniceispirillum sp.]
MFPLCATAQADNHTSEKTGSDMYVGISVGKAKQNLSFTSAAAAAIHDPDVTTMSLFVGMDLNETFAIEGFYANHGKSTFRGITDTVKLSTMGIAAKAGTDLTDDFRAFVKVGYHSWKSESDTKDDSTDVLYGIGVEYKLTETIAVVTGYDRVTYGTSNVTDMSIGIKYRL